MRPSCGAPLAGTLPCCQDITMLPVSFHDYCVATACLHQFLISHYCTMPPFSLLGLARFCCPLPQRRAVSDGPANLAW